MISTKPRSRQYYNGKICTKVKKEYVQRSESINTSMETQGNAPNEYPRAHYTLYTLIELTSQ
jgi:hypothetical protein